MNRPAAARARNGSGPRRRAALSAVRRRLTGLVIALVTCAGLAACGAPDGQPADSGGAGGAGGARTYQVRGLIQSLPDPASGAGELRIRHEAIPDLVGASGEVEGMAAMTMPFPVAAEVDLGGLAAGDPVLFELRVEWDAARPVAVTAIEKLPAATELALD